jgi:hypothetical protein
MSDAGRPSTGGVGVSGTGGAALPGSGGDGTGGNGSLGTGGGGPSSGGAGTGGGTSGSGGRASGSGGRASSTGGASSGTGGRLGTGGAPTTTTGGRSGTGGAAPTGSGGAAGASTGSWRPFNDQSPWNTKIPANPELDPNSATMVSDIASLDPFWINIEGFGVPVYYADTATPIRTITVKPGIAGIGFDNNKAMAPIPDGAKPDAQSDHHVVFVDRAQNKSWDLWAATVSGTAWTCEVCATTDLAGTGVRPAFGVANPWYASTGARASGFPLMAGLILVDEVKAGTINHALALAYPHIRSRYFVPPASTAQGTTGEALPTRGVPSGGRFQLDPALDINTLGLSAAGKMIAKAMQDYGVFVGDFSGSTALYIEAGPAAQTAWQGVIGHEEASKIPLNRLRVLKLGTLLDNNN